jgi:hypothetical protein
LPQKFSKICQTYHYDGQAGHIQWIKSAEKHPRNDNGKDKTDDRSDNKNMPVAH